MRARSLTLFALRRVPAKRQCPTAAHCHTLQALAPHPSMRPGAPPRMPRLVRNSWRLRIDGHSSDDALHFRMIRCGARRTVFTALARLTDGDYAVGAGEEEHDHHSCAFCEAVRRDLPCALCAEFRAFETSESRALESAGARREVFPAWQPRVWDTAQSTTCKIADMCSSAFRGLLLSAVGPGVVLRAGFHSLRAAGVRTPTLHPFAVLCCCARQGMCGICTSCAHAFTHA